MLQAFSPIQEVVIRQHLSPASCRALQRISLLDSVDSTNAFLLQLPAAERHSHAVLADQQTAGRGRRGKQWQSPPGSNIYLSLGWTFANPGGDFSCLSLAIGVAVVRALESLGITHINKRLGLKWPNDIQAAGKKLGGILLESKPVANGGISVVLGIGLNIAMPAVEAAAQAIDQPWTSLAELMPGMPDPKLRDRLAGFLLEQLVKTLGSFETAGFEPFRADWERLDVLSARQVTVISAAGEIHGQALGIDRQGNLQVAESTASGKPQQNSFSSAEVSVRWLGQVDEK